MSTPAIQREVPPDLPYLTFEKIAGRGGMSVVWRAWHKTLQIPVAVKVLDAAFAENGHDLRQFMMEVRTMTDLDHPHIVKGYGADRAPDGRYFFLMDFVDGYTFGSLLARKRRLPEEDALIICESVAAAMHYAWETAGIVHCDIKPDNIMTDRDGTVKVTDLGLCQSTGRMTYPAADDVIGTPAYISPEQIYGDLAIDCRADIYSLGATLYHLMTGRMLFPDRSNDDILRAHVDPLQQAPDPRTLNPAISDPAAQLLARMLVKEREGRYANWLDVAQDLANIEHNAPLQPFPAGFSSSVQRC